MTAWRPWSSGRGRLYALFVAAAAILPYRNLILFHFYVQGAFFWDTGLLAGLIWHRDPSLPRFPFNVVGPPNASHLMPLLSALTWLSWHTPLNLAEFYAAILGIGHGLPAIGVFWLLVEGFGARTDKAMAIAAVMAVVFAFNGVALAIIRFPHPEILIASGMILLSAALALGRRYVCLGLLVFTLSVREDAGFHIFGLLAILVLLNLWQGHRWRDQRFFALIGALGLVYSAGALFLQWVLYRGAYSSLMHNYIGNPPFAGLSVNLVAARLFGLPVYRAYIVLPAMVAIVWAVRARNPLIVAGYLAFLPWLALQLIGVSTISGTLSGYYAFPFLVAAAWPLAAVIIDAKQRRIVPDYRTTVIGFGAMLAASFVGISDQWVNGGPIDLWRGFTYWPSLQHERATDRAVALLVAAQTTPGSTGIGDLAVSEGIISLAPYSFTPAHTIYAGGSEPRPDTVAYFVTGRDRARAERLIASAGLTHWFRFDDTSIVLASDRDLTGLAGTTPIKFPIPSEQ